MLDLLTLGSRWTLVGGKGGVGKTTTAAALAISLADRGDRVLVLSVDPAHSLSDVLGVPLGPDPSPVSGVPRLEALEVDAGLERRRFLETRRGRLLELVERGTYLERADVEPLVDLAVPGIDELAALFRLMDLARDEDRHLVIDTAPTGHTLRLLDLPRLARSWLAALEAMEEKHQAVAAALTSGGYAGDEVTALLGDLAADLDRLAALLSDPARTRFVLVTNPGEVVLAETRRYQAALAEREIGLGGVVVDRSPAEVSPEAEGRGMVFVPPLDFDPRGPDALRRFAAAASAIPRAGSPEPGERQGLAAGGPFRPPPDRRLYLVGGKGGVGKSTVAAALAVHLADRRGGRVLLLSIDPAGSLSEVLGSEVGPRAEPVPGVDGLFARQLDAAAAWEEFRREYRDQAERLFSGLMGGGLSAGADQRVVQRLVDLAPPGLDELVALLEVVDLTEDRPYDALVVDTAPTGHLLRLLELPELAIEWTSVVLRLLLKYRQVVGLGELAERVLRLSRELKAFRVRLEDPSATWMLAVALPQSLSVPETERMLTRLRQLGVPPGALLVNRLTEGPGSTGPASRWARELVSLALDIPAVAAPEMRRSAVGVPALRDFIAGWREIMVEDAGTGH